VRVLRLGWPVIGFVLITPVTAVQQVLRRISAPFGVGLKMIDGQFPTGVSFRHPTKLTRKLCPLSHSPSDICRDTHAGSRVEARGSWRCKTAFSRRRVSLSTVSSWMR